MDSAHRSFIEANTAILAPPLLPEIRLHLASSVTPLWHATERELRASGIEPPFWAFAWAGGQALARTLLDAPELCRGLTVLDFASGSGLCAIAAAMAGARRVVAVERDPIALAAIALNAERHGALVEALQEPTVERWDVVLAGDVCYDAAMAREVIPWLRARAGEGAKVLLGDPGRAYLPSEGLVELRRVRVPIIDDVEAETERVGIVYSVLAC